MICVPEPQLAAFAVGILPKIGPTDPLQTTKQRTNKQANKTDTMIGIQ